MRSPALLLGHVPLARAPQRPCSVQSMTLRAGIGISGAAGAGAGRDRAREQGELGREGLRAQGLVVVVLAAVLAAVPMPSACSAASAPVHSRRAPAPPPRAQAVRWRRLSRPTARGVWGINAGEDCPS